VCDTMVIVPEAGAGEVWFAKNSDREPGEPQVLEHRLAAPAAGAHVEATWMRVPEGAATSEVVLSRPAWMWGAEIGVNEHGVAIGNEATFTRVPVATRGLTGMDLLRLAIERARTAEEALDRIVWLIARYGQGGRCGFRDRSFRYHSSFLLADRGGAWVLETADRHWAAARARGITTLSNALTIDAPERIGAGTIDAAIATGLWDGRGEFSFRRVFGRPGMALLAGASTRRAGTRASLRRGDGAGGGELARAALALRDHGGHAPSAGLRMGAACAHATALPTRSAGQTTASLVASLGAGAPRVWATGTSAPCLSVFKPVPMATGARVDTGPGPAVGRADESSLFWRHERLHRAVMRRSYEAARDVFEADRAELERAAWRGGIDAGEATELFRTHRERLPAWAAAVEATTSSPARGVSERLSRWFWAREAEREGL
jgi:secernin